MAPTTCGEAGYYKPESLVAGGRGIFHDGVVQREGRRLPKQVGAMGRADPAHRVVRYARLFRELAPA